jgi:Domain of unknown function (DUF929)
VSDQDDPDVIEQAPRFSLPRMRWRPSGPWTPAGKRPAVLAAAVVVCALLAVAGSFAVLRLTSSGPADPLAGLVTEVTTVPVSHPALADVPLPTLPTLPTPQPTLPPASSGTSAYSSSLQIEDMPVAVSGARLTKAGRPEVLYVGAGYCPYCAEENWALIVALSRFGRFAGLTTSRSPRFEGIAPIDSWTFYGSSYASPYLAFVPVETISNVLVSPKANPGDASSYRALQRLTPAQQAVFDKYDSEGSTPFIDFANEAAQTGSGILPSLLAGKTWQQIAAALRQPNTPLGAALLNEANTLTAEMCRLTGGRPVAVCPR